MEKEQIDEIAARLREYIGALDGMEEKELTLEQVKSIMAAEKIFASGQDVSEFEPEDIEDFTHAATTVKSGPMTPLQQVSGSNYPAGQIPGGGVAAKFDPTISKTRMAFLQGIESSGLKKKYGLHTFEVEAMFEKDAIKFCCMTPQQNRICATVDRIDLVRHATDELTAIKMAITSALIEIEGYLKANPGV